MVENIKYQNIDRNFLNIWKSECYLIYSIIFSHFNSIVWEVHNA